MTYCCIKIPNCISGVAVQSMHAGSVSLSLDAYAATGSCASHTRHSSVQIFLFNNYLWPRPSRIGPSTVPFAAPPTSRCVSMSNSVHDSPLFSVHLSSSSSLIWRIRCLPACRTEPDGMKCCSRMEGWMDATANGRVVRVPLSATVLHSILPLLLCIFFLKIVLF